MSDAAYMFMTTTVLFYIRCLKFPICFLYKASLCCQWW